MNICPDRANLVKAVMEHAKLYDGVGGIIEYADINGGGMIDVMAMRNEGKTATLYAVACGCHPELENREFVSKRLQHQKRFIENNFPTVERINMVYVTDEHAYRIQ